MSATEKGRKKKENRIRGRWNEEREKKEKTEGRKEERT